MGNPMSVVLEGLQAVLDALAPEHANPAPSGSCPLSISPCRVALYPGDQVAYDTCQTEVCTEGDGQLWANLMPVAVVNPGNPGCTDFVITAQVGVVRCGPRPEDPVDVIEAAAIQQALDADEILNVFTCCDALPERWRDMFTPVAWAPISEQGGCFGGVWTVSAMISKCCP